MPEDRPISSALFVPSSLLAKGRTTFGHSEWCRRCCRGRGGGLLVLPLADCPNSPGSTHAARDHNDGERLRPDVDRLADPQRPGARYRPRPPGPSRRSSAQQSPERQAELQPTHAHHDQLDRDQRTEHPQARPRQLAE